jgi:hypothetical protein
MAEKRVPSKERVSARARGAFAATVRAGAASYRRERMLPGLVGLWPRDLRGEEPEATRCIVRRLAAALRAERNRGRAGHWSYDLNRHIALHQAYAAERARLAAALAMQKAAGCPRPFDITISL